MKCTCLDPQSQVLSTKEEHLPQRDNGQGIRDKHRRQRTGKSRGNRGEGRDVCPRRTKD